MYCITNIIAQKSFKEVSDFLRLAFHRFKGKIYAEKLFGVQKIGCPFIARVGLEFESLEPVVDPGVNLEGQGDTNLTRQYLEQPSPIY